MLIRDAVVSGRDTRRPRGRNAESTAILLASTLRWPLAARLAIAFSRLGCQVQAWCPVGHPLEKTHAVGRIHRCDNLTPGRSLRAAIHSAGPDLIIPCDDDAAIHLRRLYPRNNDTGAASLRKLIEISLGAQASSPHAGTRDELMRLAQAADVRVPAGGQLASSEDLVEWAARYGFPAVLKLDHTWGGQGVAIVRDLAQAQSVFRDMRHPSLLHALSDLILRRDWLALQRRLGSTPAAVTIQKFVAGRPANRAVACWRGEVLAGVSVLALQTQGPTGPATVVQVIDNEEMSVAARRVVRGLGLSGFCGLDFVIESSTGDACLVEVNPRATPVCHLALGAGLDLPAALYARLQGQSLPPSTATPRSDIIALFPGEWHRDPASPYLQSAVHDVPWAEIDLVRDCVELPWEARGLFARLRARLLMRHDRHLPRFPGAGLPARDATR